MTVPSKTRKDYYADWYEENGDDLNDRRRDRYANDPEYKAKVRQWNQEARERRKKTRKAEKRAEKRAVKMKASAGAWKTVDHEVDGVLTRMFTIGALARAVGKGISTIRVWERTGTMPETPYRSEKGDRLYTVEMVEDIIEGLDRVGKLDHRRMKKRKKPSSVIRTVKPKRGQRRDIRLYKIGTLAQAVSRTVVALTNMEKREVLPRTPLLASSLEYRLYTVEMIEAVQKAFAKRGGVVRGHSEWEDFHDEIFDAWDEQGILDAKVIE